MIIKEKITIRKNAKRKNDNLEKMIIIGINNDSYYFYIIPF